ncbi:outer membrane beta-barrel protein [Niabella drilacis]|uniref:Outer membrane protein beta-barrel domain-containing protein n=1 Tax=Niabella drilacis (strain DSM 25811 / CCM 8410 / CCUG 62505 / LMG 26954 / E90) TaxID=1285928 RepID=A0A1G6YS71_NIADE|nr:outer membrane beta-barrel protein [Niabella drilacis]SDD92505.1 Outer membrane protein beta-barrel domain-containing protein [Niabella drilacis]
MKRILIIICLLVFPGLFFSVEAQVRWGLRAGVNFTNVSAVKNGKPLNTGIRTGFKGGADAAIPLGRLFRLEPGLLFSTKGYKNGEAVKINANACYLELPVNFIYSPEVGSGNLLLGAGPYLGYGLGGRWKTPGVNSGSDFRTEMKGNLQFANDTKMDDYYYIAPGSSFTYGRPVDAGVNFLAGYELSGNLALRLEGQLGITDLAPKVEGQTTKDHLKNVGFGISAGYKF